MVRAPASYKRKVSAASSSTIQAIFSQFRLRAAMTGLSRKLEDGVGWSEVVIA